jgi:hypothetical protein
MCSLFLLRWTQVVIGKWKNACYYIVAIASLFFIGQWLNYQNCPKKNACY